MLAQQFMKKNEKNPMEIKKNPNETNKYAFGSKSVDVMGKFLAKENILKNYEKPGDFDNNDNLWGPDEKNEENLWGPEKDEENLWGFEGKEENLWGPENYAKKTTKPTKPMEKNEKVFQGNFGKNLAGSLQNYMKVPESELKSIPVSHSYAPSDSNKYLRIKKENPNPLYKSTSPESKLSKSKMFPPQNIEELIEKSQKKQFSGSFSNQVSLKDASIDFVYKNDFDENGVFYYLGTQGIKAPFMSPHLLGYVKVFASSLRSGNIENFVSREIDNISTHNEKNSFIGVDLGVDRFLMPHCYTIQNRDSSTYALLNWIFEASIDMQRWHILDKRIHFSDDEEFNRLMKQEREILKMKCASSTWMIDMNNSSAILQDIKENTKKNYPGFRYFINKMFFRYFRIVQIMKNSNGSFNLCLSNIEMYGRGFGQKWLF